MRRANVSRAEPRDIHAGLSTIEERLAAQGRTLEEVVRRLKAQRIETPSWGYANSGTRFKVFPQPGVPRSVEEKLTDAAQVHQLTGVAPSVALHIPWDRVDDWTALRHYAEGLGLTLGAINPNLFQDEAYRLGSLAHRLGPQAQVLVDLGHHAQGVNIEQIVAILLDEGRLGGFHFNGRKYGDDDLIVGSTNPLELFLIYNELAAAEEDEDPAVANCARAVAYMIDQSHNVEPKIPAMLVSVMNCQAAYAKALLVDRAALRRAQQVGDVLGAHCTLMDAFETDVRPLLARVREEMGAAADPLRAYAANGYQQKIERERVGSTQMGW